MPYVGKGPIDRTLGLSQKNVFTGDGSTVNFDMTTAAPDGGDTAVDVFIDNVRQEPGTGKAYVLAQVSDEWKRITFTTAPASGAVIWVLNRLRTQITNLLPGDNTVTSAMIQDNAVTGTKIALGSDAQGDFMYYNGTDWVRLAAGTSGEAILSGGSGANPTWGSAGDFKNGGDAGGADRTLGNTDAYSLGFETNNIDSIDTKNKVHVIIQKVANLEIINEALTFAGQVHRTALEELLKDCSDAKIDVNKSDQKATG